MYLPCHIHIVAMTIVGPQEVLDDVGLHIFGFAIFGDRTLSQPQLRHVRPVD